MEGLLYSQGNPVHCSIYPAVDTDIWSAALISVTQERSGKLLWASAHLFPMKQLQTTTLDLTINIQMVNLGENNPAHST